MKPFLDSFALTTAVSTGRLQLEAEPHRLLVYLMKCTKEGACRRRTKCSMLQAIQISEKSSVNKLNWTYVEENRIGDHIWYVSGVRRF